MASIIEVVNLNTYSRELFAINRGQYIGRANGTFAESPLANPFKMDNHSHTRTRVLELYSLWLRDRILGDTRQQREINRLRNVLANEGVLVLGCFCKPLPCHGDIVSKFIRGDY